MDVFSGTNGPLEGDAVMAREEDGRERREKA
jgi:hypothetical protein